MQNTPAFHILRVADWVELPLAALFVVLIEIDRIVGIVINAFFERIVIKIMSCSQHQIKLHRVHSPQRQLAEVIIKSH
ncbi:hypothetical protein D3C71_2146840 [compost metagenome]